MYFLYNAPNEFVGIYIVSTTDEAVTLASELGISAGEYALFNNLDDLPAGWESYPQGVTLELGAEPAYGYSLNGAKLQATTDVKIQNAELVGMASNNFSSQMIAAQSTLPEGDRIASIAGPIANVNSLANSLQIQLDAIQAATSISELNDIVNLPTGILFTGRGSGDGPEDLNISYYTEFVSTTIPESDTELYVPSTDSIIPYGSGPTPDTFDSLGNCFEPGDYILQIRQASTSLVIGQIVVPYNPAGQDVSF